MLKLIKAYKAHHIEKRTRRYRSNGSAGALPYNMHYLSFIIYALLFILYSLRLILCALLFLDPYSTISLPVNST